MRIIFMGSPEFAVPSLDALVEGGHEVVAVYSQPPRPAGRGKGGEIDLIVVRGRTVVFVEVKARAILGAAREAVTANKRRARVYEVTDAGRQQLEAQETRWRMVTLAVCQPLATSSPNWLLAAVSSLTCCGCGSNSSAYATIRSRVITWVRDVKRCPTAKSS